MRRSVTKIYPWLLDLFVEHMCECCGRRPYTVGVSDPYVEGRDYSETLYCDDCHIEVFGRIGRAW